MTRPKRRPLLRALLLLVPLLVGLGLRVGGLADRPLHNDEAINARKLAELWSGGEYRYDPHEYHGPTLYYLSLPVLRLAAIGQPDQPDEAVFRWVPLLAGLALIALVALAADGLGPVAAWTAALLTAVSPALVYYSRYYIHEPLLVLFTAVFLAGAWRFAVRPRPGWAVFSGAGLGLMWATKETFVFAVAAAAVAGIVTLLTTPPASTPAGSDGPRSAVARGVGRVIAGIRWIGGRALLLAGLVAVVVGGLLLTSFLAHPAGVVDAVRTYLIWGERAGGATPHVQPWHFYLSRLAWFHARGAPVWTEGLILGLAVVGGVAGFVAERPGGADRGLVRFLAVYTVTLAAMYSAIPYKTPWCLLGFLHGAVLLAGVGASVILGAGRGGSGGRQEAHLRLVESRFNGPDRGLEPASGPASEVRPERNSGVRRTPALERRERYVPSTIRRCARRRIGVGFLLMSATVQLAVQAWRGSREYGADFRTPYVYGHTSADIRNLLELVDELARMHPDGRGMAMQVVAPESAYWPLPWYFRRFANVGWYDALPAGPYAPVVIAALKANTGLEEKTGQAWRAAGMFELRPRYFVEVHVEAGFWKRFLEARAAERGAGP